MELIKKRWYFILISFIIAGDQLTKYLIRSHFNQFEQTDVVRGFIKLIYIRNTGVIWGLFNNHEGQLIRLAITILSVAALLTVLYIFLKTSSGCRLELISLSFVLGGALGNILDRLLLGYVVDFIDVYIKSYHWPTFNIADSFISVGIVLLLISVLRNNCIPLKEKEK